MGDKNHKRLTTTNDVVFGGLFRLVRAALNWILRLPSLTRSGEPMWFTSHSANVAG